MKNQLHMNFFSIPLACPLPDKNTDITNSAQNSILVEKCKVWFWILKGIFFFQKMQPKELGIRIGGNQITNFDLLYLQDFQSS